MSVLLEIPAAIDRVYEKSRKNRGRLGLSEVGSPCARFLWYAHKGYPSDPIEGRVLRLFQLGNLLEGQIIKDLRCAGISVSRQQETVKVSRGSCKLTGRIDGIAVGVPGFESEPHLLEIKTSNAQRFSELKKLKSYVHWDAKYAGQVQVYTSLLPDVPPVRRILVVVYCKDTSELYVERLAFNPGFASDLLDAAFDAISQEEPPARRCPHPNFFEVRFCRFAKECFPDG